MLTVSICIACIMQHVAGAFLEAPSKERAMRKEQERKLAFRDMDLPLAEFITHIGPAAAAATCKSWVTTFGADAQAGCKASFILTDPACDKNCQNAFKKDPLFLSDRCPATCQGGSRASSKAKSLKSRSAWAMALENKFSLDSKEDKVRKEKKAKKAKNDKKARKDKEDEENEAEDKSEKLAAEKQEEDEAAVKVDKKEAKAVKVHADKVDTKKDDTKEDKKEAKAEKVDAKKDETKVDKKEAKSSKFMGDKSEKKVDKEADSDEDVQAEIKAEAMKASESKTWKKKEAKKDVAKPDNSWGSWLR